MRQVMDLLRKSLQQDGLTATSRFVLKELRRRYRFWLLKRELEPGGLLGSAAGHVRVADSSCMDRIVAAWPEEFGGSKSRGSASRKIAGRFERGYPCVISESEGQVEGAVWCVPWEFDDKLRPTKSRQDAFEICNLFVSRTCRGRGIGRQLLAGALSLMAAEGKRNAYSRILPERQASTILHLSQGFRLMGILYSTTTLGRERSRLVPLTKARPADVRGLAMPPCLLLVQGAWGSTLEAVRRLGSRGVPVYVFVLNRDPAPYAKSRYCREARRLGASDAASVSRELVDWCKAQRFSQRPVLLPFTDVAATFVAEARPILEDYFTVGSPDPGTVRSVMDKGQAQALAIACGLDVPQTAVVRTHTDLQAAAKMGKYPVLAKPIWWRTKGDSDFKTMTFETPEALVAGLTPTLEGGAAVLVQEYIQGADQNVETFLFYRDRRGTVWGCTSRKLRQSPPYAGIMATGHAIEIPELRELCERFLNRIDYRGLGGIEFKRSGHRLVYIETNPRLGAFHGLARKAGLDLVWIAYCDGGLGGLMEPPYGQEREAYYLNWSALWGSYGFRQAVPWVGCVLRMLARHPLKIAIFEWTDPGPSAYLIRKSIRERLRRSPKGTRPSPFQGMRDAAAGKPSLLPRKDDLW
jgi:predicted ATP-grasp superfamily ATP-dependent carboligase/L-amino acid N-acyltransferase YncA